MLGGRERIERFRDMERDEELTVMCGGGGGDELGSGKGSKEVKEEERKKEKAKGRP